MTLAELFYIDKDLNEFIKDLLSDVYRTIMDKHANSEEIIITSKDFTYSDALSDPTSPIFVRVLAVYQWITAGVFINAGGAWNFGVSVEIAILAVAVVFVAASIAIIPE